MNDRERNTLAGLALGLAFLVSVVGDWFFESQWSNLYWYLFEAVVWGIGFSAFFLLLKSRAGRGGESAAKGPESDEHGTPHSPRS